MNHEALRSIMFSNNHLGGVRKESINSVSPLPPSMTGNSNRFDEIPQQQSHNQRSSSHQSTKQVDNTQSTEQIPFYHGNQGGLPQTLHPAGASFRAHDYNRGVNQGLTIEQSKDLGDSNQSVEKVPLYSGNLGRSYRMMFPMGASFRNRDSNQGAIQQHPTFPVDINQDKQRPVNSTNQGQSS